VKAVVVMVRALHEDGSGIVTVGDRMVVDTTPRARTPAGQGDAGALQRDRLADVLAAARSVPGAIVRIAVAPGGRHDAVADLEVPPGHVFEARGQSGGDHHRFAIADLFRRGAKQVVLVAGDRPRLTGDLVQDAFAALEATPRHVVLGPSSDGRQYLLGLAGKEVPDVFTGVRWNTAYELHDMLRRCEFEERRVTFLPLLDA
jgi:glycosyltransferase A (GT-A) superfamily protein (DUF2064 family)